MADQRTILEQLNESGLRLSKGHRKIAAFIEENYDKAVFMTASKLGQVVDVSESTVVRFAIACGYEGYPQLQRALKEIVRHRLTSAQRFAMAGDLEDTDLPSAVLRTDMRNIKATLDALDPALFQAVVAEISAARSLYILGLRSAAPLAQFLSYYLLYVLDDVRLVNNINNDVFEVMARCKPGDVLVGISFPRYSNRTLEAMVFAKSRGLKVIGITDGSLSPLHEVCDYCLDARTDMTSFVDSLAAPLSLISGLIAAIGNHNREALKGNFSQLEEVWDTYRVYAGKD
ncbi:MAG: MurR/RpiR family transcriptional regulator [Christensenellales bacterium]